MKSIGAMSSSTSTNVNSTGFSVSFNSSTFFELNSSASSLSPSVNLTSVNSYEVLEATHLSEECSFDDYIVYLFPVKNVYNGVTSRNPKGAMGSYLGSFLDLQFIFSLLLFSVVIGSCVWWSGVLLLRKLKFSSGIERRFEIVTLKVSTFQNANLFQITFFSKLFTKGGGALIRIG